MHRPVHGECRLCKHHVELHPRTYFCDACWHATPGHRRRAWKQQLTPRVDLPVPTIKNKLLAEATSAEVLRQAAEAKEFKPRASAGESTEQRKLRIQ